MVLVQGGQQHREKNCFQTENLCRKFSVVGEWRQTPAESLWSFTGSFIKFASLFIFHFCPCLYLLGKL